MFDRLERVANYIRKRTNSQEDVFIEKLWQNIFNLILKNSVIVLFQNYICVMIYAYYMTSLYSCVTCQQNVIAQINTVCFNFDTFINFIN